MSCLKCLGSEPESRQLQVRQGWGGPGGRAKEGSALPSNNTGAVALEPALGFPAGTRRTQKRGQKRGQELLGGNQGCQGDGPPLRGRGGFCGQPQFPNPGLQARVVWGKEQGERGGPQPPPLGLSPRQYIGHAEPRHKKDHGGMARAANSGAGCRARGCRSTVRRWDRTAPQGPGAGPEVHTSRDR